MKRGQPRRRILQAMGSDWSHRIESSGAKITRNKSGEGYGCYNVATSQTPRHTKSPYSWQLAALENQNCPQRRAQCGLPPLKQIPPYGLQTLITTNLQNSLLTRTTSKHGQRGPTQTRRRTEFDTRSSTNLYTLTNDAQKGRKKPDGNKTADLVQHLIV